MSDDETTSQPAKPAPSSVKSPAGDTGAAPVAGMVPAGQQRVRALFDYDGEEGDLSFKAGDIIIVHGKDPHGWWLGEKDGVRALVPSNFVAEITN